MPAGALVAVALTAGALPGGAANCGWPGLKAAAASAAGGYGWPAL
jgi:hypothetical protein